MQFQMEFVTVHLFIAGFNHISNPEIIDLYSLRLCFQVFIEGKEKGNFNIALKPVVSNLIYNKSKISFLHKNRGRL
jgi:c-Rel proto-oncogene protein